MYEYLQERYRYGRSDLIPGTIRVLVVNSLHFVKNYFYHEGHEVYEETTKSFIQFFIFVFFVI